MRKGLVGIEGENCYAIMIDYIKSKSNGAFIKELDNIHIIIAERFSWLRLGSITLCFIIENLEQHKCSIEIIYGNDRSGIFRISSDQGYFATQKFFSEVRALARLNKWKIS
ncbi:MAG: hypothetical protein H6600_02130 [Flavobacteriales bacterium]|nr:hypothetical protein [Flavobacteriales bacterium]MCB9197229.1 hypothetical protein [Flavobacteriales bacterium]